MTDYNAKNKYSMRMQRNLFSLQYGLLSAPFTSTSGNISITAGKSSCTSTIVTIKAQRYSCFIKKRCSLGATESEDDMCNRRFAINQLVLGSRVLGYELWDGRQVCELTATQILKDLKDGKEIIGLCPDSSGETLVLDSEKALYTNMMVHRHIGQYTPLMDTDTVVSVFFIVTGLCEKDGRQVYQTISSKFERKDMSLEQLLAYYDMGAICGGCRVADGKIILSGFIGGNASEVVDSETPKTGRPAKTNQAALTDPKKKGDALLQHAESQSDAIRQTNQEKTSGTSIKNDRKNK